MWNYETKSRQVQSGGNYCSLLAIQLSSIRNYNFPQNRNVLLTVMKQETIAQIHLFNNWCELIAIDLRGLVKQASSVSFSPSIINNLPTIQRAKSQEEENCTVLRKLHERKEKIVLAHVPGFSSSPICPVSSLYIKAINACRASHSKSLVPTSPSF